MQHDRRRQEVGRRRWGSSRSTGAASWRSAAAGLSARSPARKSAPAKGQVDVDELAQRGQGAAEGGGGGTGAASAAPRPAAAGARSPPSPSAAAREYWIAAEPVEWDIVPTHRDEMMAEPVKGEDQVQGLRLPRLQRRTSKSRSGRRRCRGRCSKPKSATRSSSTSATRLEAPVTMHPHGIFYSDEMDGAYKGKFTDPGGFVQTQPHLHLRLGSARRGPKGPGSTTTTGRWTRCRSSRACSGRW